MRICTPSFCANDWHTRLCRRPRWTKGTFIAWLLSLIALVVYAGILTAVIVVVRACLRPCAANAIPHHVVRIVRSVRYARTLRLNCCQIVFQVVKNGDDSVSCEGEHSQVQASMHFCIRSTAVYLDQHASVASQLAPLSCRELPIWGVPVCLKGSSGSIIAPSAPIKKSNPRSSCQMARVCAMSAGLLDCNLVYASVVSLHVVNSQAGSIPV